MQLDNSFHHAYECELITCPPVGGPPIFCYPGGIAGGWVHGIAVKITPHSHAETWIGSFANGDLSPNATSGLYSHPASNRILVVAKGDAHIVNVDNPADFNWLKVVVPIMGVVPIPELGRLLMYDFVRILAVGKEGILWRTPSLSWDGLTIENVSEGSVHGYGWDAPNNRKVPFEVNVLSGEYSGGASPEILGF